MDSDSITVKRDGIVVEITLEEVSDTLGNQYILGDVDSHEFAYLAALALETRNNGEYDIERTLMEFIRNESELDITREECDEIEEILR